VTRLAEHGHEAVPASPNSGVNTLTGEGLDDVLKGAEVVADVSNSPSFGDAVTRFGWRRCSSGRSQPTTSLPSPSGQR
jgi:hypothetical protein